jgi:signal transduction histidine kinase
MKYGIRYKLTAVVVVIILVMGVVLVTLQYRHERGVMRAELVKRGVSLARGLAYNAQYGVLTGDRSECRALVAGVLAQDDVFFAALLDARGEVLALEQKRGAPSPRPRGVTELAVEQLESPAGAPHIEVAVPVETLRAPEDEGVDRALALEGETAYERVRIGECQVGMSLAGVREQLKRITLTLIILVGAVILMGGAAIVVAANRFVIRPAIRLLEGARTVAEGNLDLEVSAGSGSADEMSLLAENFNAMVRSLRRSRDALSKQLAEIDRLNSLKSEFLASVSHELRTPLNSIIGYSQLLLAGIDGELNAEQEKSLSKILRNGQNLLALINDILDLSKIESGRMDLQLESFRFEECLNAALATIAPLRRDEEIALRLEVDPDLPELHLDQAKLKQILLNLLSNAFKFTRRGSVTVRARQVDGQLEVSVADTGVGIPADHLEEIFEEFVQVRNTASRAEGGTGLGLPITRKLVRLMQGAIEVTSEVGVGTTFTVRLPLRLERKDEAPVEGAASG